jgi:hypothetical protein
VLVRVIPVVLTVFLGACTDYGLNERKDDTYIQPAISVSPASLAFALATLDVPETDVFQVTNVGSARLEISSMTLLGSGNFSFTVPDYSDGLEPSESLEVVVEYSPDETGVQDDAAIFIENSDHTNSVVQVPLVGQVDMPLVVISPSPLDMGQVVTDDLVEDTLFLTSAGQVPVTLNRWEVSGDVFSLVEGDAWPMTLEPGEETTLDVTFAPTVAGSFTETFLVHTESPAPDSSALLLGGGVSADPIAVCSADPTEVHPGEPATWVGSASYDAAGYQIVQWDWNLLARPSGSTSSFPTGSSADRPGFVPDLAGEYRARLMVTNELGMVSTPCVATLLATPEEDLWIQMSWTHSGDDMDLHLLRPGGALRTTNDCYYGNCRGGGLDWGSPGVTADNPVLDLDDIGGTGPENINISSPETGTFTVYVHDYPGSSYTPANDVTLTIFVGGYQAWTDTRSISGEDSDEAFAEVEWPSGVVTGL